MIAENIIFNRDEHRVRLEARQSCDVSKERHLAATTIRRLAIQSAASPPLISPMTGLDRATRTAYPTVLTPPELSTSAFFQMIPIHEAFTAVRVSANISKLSPDMVPQARL
jgi:hypothetical protein